MRDFFGTGIRTLFIIIMAVHALSSELRAKDDDRQAHVKAIFRRIDKNHDEELRDEEITSAQKTVRSGLALAVKQLNSTQLRNKNIPFDRKAVVDRCDTLKIDEDGDGRVTEQELVRFFLAAYEPVDQARLALKVNPVIDPVPAPNPDLGLGGNNNSRDRARDRELQRLRDERDQESREFRAESRRREQEFDRWRESQQRAQFERAAREQNARDNAQRERDAQREQRERAAERSRNDENRRQREAEQQRRSLESRK